MDINVDVDLLSGEQEQELARAVEVGVFAAHALAMGSRPGGATEQELRVLVAGGEAARQEFFVANLRLVRHRAAHWSQNTGVAVEELFQEGCVGLGEAIRRFDWARGHRFITLAFPLVEGAVARQAQSRCGVVDVSRHQVRKLVRIRRASEDLAQRLGRAPRIQEIADLLGMKDTVVRQVLERGAGRGTGLDEDIRADDDPGEHIPEAVDVSWLNLLGDRERTILTARFGIGTPARSRDQLARTMGVSLSTVRREELRALGMARRVLASLDGDGRMEQWHHALHAS